MSLAKCPSCGHRRFDTDCDACERRQCGYTSYTVCPVNGCHRRAGDYERPHNHPNPVLAALADSPGEPDREASPCG